jgi:AMP-binding enzyme/AMP-binding enzyme C-terminal domain
VAPKPTKNHASQSSAGGAQALRSRTAAIEHAVRVIRSACYLAGSRDLVREIRANANGRKIRAAIASHDTPPLFDWLFEALSYQGIADRVAYDYMQRHGRITWRDIEQHLSRRVSCPKLRSYWHYYDCRYQKSQATCTELNHISRCPVPTHNLRNGRINQTAYSLFLFIRDIAGCNLVGWIDAQFCKQAEHMASDQLARMPEALIRPLRNVTGISDKVIAMALSSILLAAPKDRPHWHDAGASLIAVDTLVHNFLHRTGILRRFAAEHAYGVACYRPRQCADIIQRVADRIDAREFGRRYPRRFPRFVQHAIWRYCAQEGHDICNGNRINDDGRCQNTACRMHGIGEIYVTSPATALEVWRNPELTAQAFYAHEGRRWWRSRDLGRIDEDGFLYIEGRQDDMIISGGLNIMPGRVEEVLLQHPGVREAAVVGVPHAEWGQQVQAAIIVKDISLTADALDAFVKTSDCRPICDRAFITSWMIFRARRPIRSIVA